MPPDFRNRSNESKLIAAQLRHYGFSTVVRSPEETIRRSRGRHHDAVLLRNAWPLDLFRDSLDTLARIGQRKNQVFSNAPDPQFGFVDNKTILLDMFRKGMPVIPTVLKKEDVAALGEPEAYVVKPIDNCFSHGVHIVAKQDLAAENTAGSVIQPFLRFEREMSFFFVDRKFVYALGSRPHDTAATASPEQRLDQHLANRWKLEQLAPALKQVKWASQFLKNARTPHGIVRIDAALMPDGKLMLMEVERNCPTLSLLELKKPLSFGHHNRLVKAIAASLKNALKASKPRRASTGLRYAKNLG